MSGKVAEKTPRAAAPVAEDEDDYSSDEYSDSEYEEEVPRQQTQALAQRQQQQQQQQQQQPGQVAAPQQKEKGHSGAPSVRLDLNIELEVTLKARIHGDLTLALLT